MSKVLAAREGVNEGGGSGTGMLEGAESWNAGGSRQRAGGEASLEGWSQRVQAFKTSKCALLTMSMSMPYITLSRIGQNHYSITGGLESAFLTVKCTY